MPIFCLQCSIFPSFLHHYLWLAQLTYIHIIHSYLYTSVETCNMYMLTDLTYFHEVQEASRLSVFNSYFCIFNIHPTIRNPLSCWIFSLCSWCFDYGCAKCLQTVMELFKERKWHKSITARYTVSLHCLSLLLEIS